MGEIFNLDDMIKKEMKGFKKDENSSAKPSEYLREYADTLQELAEIIRSYLDIADEYLQDMIGQTKLDYRDFCIEEDDIEVFLESITDSNLAPVIYMNHAADGKVYRATICLLETSEEFVDVKGSLEMYDSKKVFAFDFDSNTWILAAEDKLSDTMQKILNSNSLESHILQEIILATNGRLDEKKYAAIKKNYAPLFALYNQVHNYMIPVCKLDNTGKRCSLYLEPRDPFRIGFRIGYEKNMYVLYQYLDPFDFSEDEELWIMNGKEPEIYLKEIDRISDCKSVVKQLCSMANRYADDLIFTVPLSFECFTETSNVKKIGKRIYFTSGEDRELFEKEKKNLAGLKGVVNSFHRMVFEYIKVRIPLPQRSRQGLAPL